MIMKEIMDQLEYSLKCAQHHHNSEPSEYWSGKIDGLYHAILVLRLQIRADENRLDADQPRWREAA